MILNPDFKQFLQLLNKNSVRYLIIGGFAVAFYGYPRYTKDFDIWVLLNPENAKNIVKTLDDLLPGSNLLHMVFFGKLFDPKQA
jgi:hypothetical protein